MLSVSSVQRIGPFRPQYNPSLMPIWVHRAGAALLLAWCLLSVVAALRTAIERGPDERAALEAELDALAADVPADAIVGYIEPRRVEEPSAIQRAQYALVPRIVSPGPGPEFVIAAPGASFDLAGYEPVAGASDEHRLYRRTR